MCNKNKAKVSCQNCIHAEPIDMYEGDEEWEGLYCMVLDEPLQDYKPCKDFKEF